MEAYEELERLFGKLYRLEHLLSLGEWDMQVNMPPKGVTARGAALGELQQHLHELLTAATTKSLFDAVEADTTVLSAKQLANLREMRRQYDNEAALPDEFVKRKMEVTTQAKMTWVEARKNNDFMLFMPALQEVVEMAREEARYRSAASGKPLYEALFNMYECGMSLESVEAIFSDVRSWLPDLLKKAVANCKDANSDVVPLEPPFSVERQKALGEHFMRVWGFDFDGGRMDVSAHPFTGMVKEDSRITTNYDTDCYTKALLATIHETGHSRYETECGPREMLGQPICNARSMTIHESQSRFAEVVIGRSAAFAEYLTPYLKEHLGDSAAFTTGNVRKLNQTVSPGFIRIQADEVCYPLHILLRYEMERALVEGALEVADVPRVWNEKMKEYLGLETEGRDDIGCLQDIHWSMGAFGYFPTYSLGSMFAVQLMATIKRELGEDTVNKCIREGSLEAILAKQKEKIWDHGCMYETEDLIQKATGEPLNTKYFREYLERRYLRNED